MIWSMFKYVKYVEDVLCKSSIEVLHITHHCVTDYFLREI